MSRILFLLALLFATVEPARAAPADPGSDIAAYARDKAFSGTVLIGRGGKILYGASFGEADRSFGVPAAADTAFRVASITKLFTAVLTLQLAEQGKLDLDKPVRAYLPDFPGERITVHHLLNHTSGLAQLDVIPTYQQAFENGIELYQRPLSPKAMLGRCCGGKPPRPAGASFEYNNADYLLLGLIIERVGKEPYEALLGRLILDPLGMRDTRMARWDAIPPRLARTYFFRDDRKALISDMPVYYENWWAAGGLVSSAPDLLKFADALYGGRLIGPAMLERMLAPGLDDYGYGLWSYSFRRAGRTYRVAKRPGSIMGANAVLYRLLDDGTTIVLLANTNRADLDAFAQHIADRLIAARRN